MTTKIVVLGELVMLALVATLPAASFYTVPDHFKSACLEQVKTISRSFERSVTSKDDFIDTARLGDRIKSGLMFSPDTTSIVLSSLKNAGLVEKTSSRAGKVIEKAHNCENMHGRHFQEPLLLPNLDS